MEAPLRSDDARNLSARSEPVLAELCHRVRTPLNGILGTLELLLDGDLDDDARELARVAYDSAVSLHHVFERNLARLQLDPGDGQPV